jgi:hypothetical protein
MADAERHENAPELLLLASLQLTEHVINAICTPLLRVRGNAPHTIKTVKVVRGKREEIGESAHAATVNKLLQQLLAKPLNVQRAATNRMAEPFKDLRLAPGVRAAMAHLIPYHFAVA